MSVPMPHLIQGDARALPLPDASVDLVVTSPPYFGLRDYGHDNQIGAEPTPAEFLDALIECTREMVRVLKPTGSIWVNLGDKYAGSPSGPQGSSGALATSYQDEIYRELRARQRALNYRVPNKSLLLLPHRYAIRCVDELGLIVRQDQVWAKPNGLPESVTDRTRRSHEYVFHLVKQPRYYSAVDEIRVPHQRGWTPGRTGGHTYQAMKVPGEKDSNLATSSPNPLGALPGSVWEIPTQPLNVPSDLGVDHFAAFPMALPRKIILGWSPREVCTTCGEGRRPIADREAVDTTATKHPVMGHITATGQRDGREGARRTLRVQVVGYVCACPDTSAPTIPGVVLDPFSGTGTTALVATMLDRQGIGVELSADYIRLARWRCNDPKERARAAGLDPDAVSKVRAELPGQVDMFDLLNDGAA